MAYFPGIHIFMNISSFGFRARFQARILALILVYWDGSGVNKGINEDLIGQSTSGKEDVRCQRGQMEGLDKPTLYAYLARRKQAMQA
jgi:hypothetical protein